MTEKSILNVNKLFDLFESRYDEFVNTDLLDTMY